MQPTRFLFYINALLTTKEQNENPVYMQILLHSTTVRSSPVWASHPAAADCESLFMHPNGLPTSCCNTSANHHHGIKLEANDSPCPCCNNECSMQNEQGEFNKTWDFLTTIDVTFTEGGPHLNKAMVHAVKPKKSVMDRRSAPRQSII